MYIHRYNEQDPRIWTFRVSGLIQGNLEETMVFFPLADGEFPAFGGFHGHGDTPKNDGL